MYLFLAAILSVAFLTTTGGPSRPRGSSPFAWAGVALGWAAAVAFGLVRDRTAGARVGAALAVSTFYLGALVLAHFLIDVAGWRITA